MHTRKLDGSISRFVWVLPPHILILTTFVLVCLSADWAGALVLNSFSFFAFRLASCLTIDLLASCFLGCSLSVVFFGWCVGACNVRLARFGLRWLSFCGLRRVVLFFLFCLCLCCRGFLWPCVCCLLLVSLGCFVLLCCWCLGLVPRGLLSPCSALPLLCPPPWLVLWCLLVQSVLCWSLPLGIWLYLRRPGCHALHGVLWRFGTFLHFSSWQQRLRPCVGLRPLHHVACAVSVLLLPALRYSPWVIQIPPQDAARAACAPLLGPCCFLPPVPAAFPGALSLFPAGLRLLPSPSSFFFRWLPLPVSLPLCFLVCCLVPLCFGLLLRLLVLFLSGFCLVWSSLFCLSVCWWFGGLCWLPAYWGD